MRTRDLALEILNHIRNPDPVTIPYDNQRDHGTDVQDNVPKPASAFFLDPVAGFKEVSGFFVMVPGSEMRTDSIPSVAMLDAWLAGMWLNHAGVSVGCGIRDHTTNGGYTLNVAPNARIEVRRIGGHADGALENPQHWYFSSSTMHRRRSLAESLATARDIAGYYDLPARRFVRAREYGDYRMFAEPTRAEQFTDGMGRPHH